MAAELYSNIEFAVGKIQVPLLWSQKRAAADLNTILVTAILLIPALKTL